MEKRFKYWKAPKFNKSGMTKWGWMCQHHEKLKLGKYVDIGAFTYLNAKFGIEIGENAQIGSHCSVYSISTIDCKVGKVFIKKGARIGTHSVIMPGVTIGKNAMVGAFSFVNKNLPDNMLAYGVPARAIKKLKKG